MTRRPSVKRLRELLSYDPDTGALTWRDVRGRGRRPGKSAGCLRDDGYIVVRIDDVLLYAHQVAWALYTGKWPRGEIDHGNGVENDNRIENLEDTSHVGNARNMPLGKRNKSGHMGVYWVADRSRWVAMIGINRHSTYLGSFINLEDALAARSAANVRFGFHPNRGRQRQAAI